MINPGGLSRDVPVVLGATAYMIIDVQNYCARPDGNEFKHLSPEERYRTYGYYFDRLRRVALPAMAQVQAACRAAGIEVMYTTIECLTQDGRDMSLDYKISGFHVPKGSWDAEVLEEIAQQGDEIRLPKTSSSVFISTNADYVLRSLGVRHLILAGVMTDQCVESAVRDACDLGYLVTLVTDACAAKSQARHDDSLRAIAGYCRQRTSKDLVAEIAALK